MMKDPVAIFNRDGILTPWEVCADANNDYWVIGRTIHGHGKRVADVHSTFTAEVESAVANMIAAAPDLYAALERIVASVPQGPSGDVCQTSDFDDAKAALAKARGESI